MTGTLSALDWLVLFLYLALLLATAFAVKRKPKNDKDYFIGEKRMPTWAVALSVLATSYSAATFIGAPADSYAGNLSYLSTAIGGVLAVLLVGWFFIPVFYRFEVVTVYELIGRRFGPGAKLATSFTFLVGRIFASGARLYIAALPFALIVRGSDAVLTKSDLVWAIVFIAAVGTVYSLAGGIISIIWTDVIQMAVFVIATGGACYLLLHRIPLDFSQIWQALAQTPVNDGNKTTLLSFDGSPQNPFTLFTALSGWLLLNVAVYGTDQDLAQRMLTCKNAMQGGRSALLAIFGNLPITFAFVLIGLLLHIFYQRPDLMAGVLPHAMPQSSDHVFLTFILHEMPSGMRGLMMAGLFAVAFSSLLSALNAMASTSINDCYRLLVKDKNPAHYLRASRLAVIFWGIILALFACICVYWKEANGEGLIPFALGIMSFAYAGLLAAFATALFSKRGSGKSIVAALLIGFLVVALLQPSLWHYTREWIFWRSWAPQAWHEATIAGPWRLCAGFSCAFACALLGKQPATR